MNVLATILWIAVAVICGLESIAEQSPFLGIAWMLGSFTALGIAAGRVFNEAKND